MAYSPFTATGDGTTTAYTIAFDYLDTTDVKARVNNVVTTAFTVVGSTVTFDTAPPSGQSIKIYRDTDNETIQADFQSGSALRAVDLNSNFTQILYVTQETTDISDTAETDAATALSTANTAATNASNALSTANSAASDIATNTSNISTNTSNIATNTSNIATNASDIATNTSDIATNASNISTNASNISTNTTDIATNTSSIATNASNISTNTSNISTNTTNIATKMPKAGGTFTGDVYFEGEVIAKGDSVNAGKITLNCEDNIHGIKIKGPPHSASANYTLTLPTSTGTNGNSLITDGSGGLSWGSPTADVSNKADVDSPTFTGTPAAPTATQGTSTTQIATTAFVNAEIAADTVNLAPKASPTFTGLPVAPTASAGTNTTQIATTQFVTSAVSDRAPSLSPSLTGTPTAPTASTGTNTTQIATTAYVQGEVNNSIQPYDADTTKNDVANTFTQLQTFDAGIRNDSTYQAEIKSSGTVDCTTGSYFKIDGTTSNVSLSSFGTPSTGVAVSITVEITLGSYSVTFPSSVKWADSTAPTFTQNKTHLAFFVTSDGGTNWYGSAITDFA